VGGGEQEKMDKKICGMLIATLFIFSALTPLIAALESEGIQTTEAKYPWTVITYTSLDNTQLGLQVPSDLWGLGTIVREPFILSGPLSLVTAPDVPNLFLYDGFHCGLSPRTRIYDLRYLMPVDDHGAVIPESGEMNYGDPNTLANFYIWAAENYPSEHILLVICHFYGWEGFNTDESSPGPKNMDIMTMPDFKEAMEKVKDAGVKMPDDVFIEACSPMMIECMYQFAHYTDYIVSNEDSIDFMTMIYRPMLTWWMLQLNPDMTPREVANFYTKIYPLLSTALITNQLGALCYLSPFFPGDHPAWNRLIGQIWYPTQFALESNGIFEVAKAVDDLSVCLLNDLDDQRNAIESARSKSEEYTMMPWFIDIYDFAKKLSKATKSDEVKSACQDVMTAVENAVAAKMVLPIDHTHHGLLVQFPLTPKEYKQQIVNEFDHSNTYYDLEFAKDTHWDEFIDAYFA
jgi:hypothetical protein